ncbi:lipoprotein [Salmonella enterica subsp. enterica]|uniref:Lipoprotein n=1 Tax=Salmonella enterica I TaxID=59201 RepID=A0A379WBA1_SALET|nr:lipoprotein [Salmonella enterica subsp. enterica]
MTSDINAWAMANGCVRVYSGLMDLMTDNEIEGVLGHELGHVSLGHSRKAMQTAYATLAARDAISATSGVAAQLPSLNWAIWRKASSIRRFLAVRSRMRMTSLTIC